MKRILLFLVLIIVACNSDNGKSVLTSNGNLILPQWAKAANIYQVNIKQYTKSGTLNAFNAHIPRLKKMGVDILLLTPVQPISVNGKSNSNLGSPYAVTDYTAVNPDYGTMDDLKSLVDQAHEVDIRVIMDWLPKATSRNHSWITDHKKWYNQGSQDLNYNNQDMRKAMIKSMEFWLDKADIDGFCIDEADKVPQDFWNQLTPELIAEKNDILLISNSKAASHRNENTHHATYGDSFYDLLLEIIKGKKRAADIDTWYENDTTKYRKGLNLMYTSNHEKHLSSGVEMEIMGDAHKAMAALILSYEGIPLVYSGQEEPLRRQLESYKKDNINFKRLEYESFYKKFLTLKHRNEALWNGAYGGKIEKLIDDKDVYAFKRERNGDVFIGFFNLSNERQEFKITEAAEFNLTDRMTNMEKNWQKGMSAAMRPWEFYIFSNVK